MRYLIFVVSILISLNSFCQSSVFILIDLSGNPLDLESDKKITHEMREDALNLVRDIVVANFNKNNYSNWEAVSLQGELNTIYHGKGNPLLDQNGYFCIIPYGARNTYQNFRIDKIQKYPDDFYTLYKYAYEFKYKDQDTFEDIAIGKAADIANDPTISIKDYFLIIIKGLGKDTDSQPYSAEELEYINNYIADSYSLGKFKFKNPEIQYTISVDKIDISKMSNPTKIVLPDNVTRKVIEIKIPKGTKKSPFKIQEGKLLMVSWSCLGCSDSVKYQVTIRGKKTNRKYTSDNKINLQLDPGTYQINVSGENIRTKEPLYIKVEKVTNYNFLYFLLIIGIIVLLFVIIRNRLKNKENKKGKNENARKSFFRETPPEQEEKKGNENYPDI